MSSGTATSFQSASLYVGDLHPEVTEAILFDTFNNVGPVASIRVCRDSVTRRSLGYAYVNFHSIMDAERALDTMNYTPIKGKPCRIMWCHRDPSIRKSGAGNVFIKNLDKSIDNKALYDTFSAFGNILSCKVVTDDNGASRGHGFVHYETAESADNAIQKVDGMLLVGKKVYVGRFVARKEREQNEGFREVRFTNVYIKNFELTTDENKLSALFSPFGKITNAIVMRNEDHSSKGFGFINFEKFEDAKRAVKEMNGKVIDVKPLYVARAQKKAEREMELRHRYEKWKLDRLNKYQGVNVYIKNLDDSFDDEKLKTAFAPFGTITSAKVMKDEKGNSKGFGFVCYQSPEEAAKAVTEMNSIMSGSKPLYVALAQRKEVRRAQLEAQHRQNAMRLQQAGGMPHSPFMPVFYPNIAQRQGYVYPQVVPRRWPQPVRPGGYQMSPYTATTNRARGQRRSVGTRGGANQAINGANNRRGAVKFSNPRRDQGQQAGHGNASANSGAHLELNPSALAAAPLEEQKRLIGDYLFPMIQKVQQPLAGKITGMFVDSLDVNELLELSENPDSLNAKINEAIQVLQTTNGTSEKSEATS